MQLHSTHVGGKSLYDALVEAKHMDVLKMPSAPSFGKHYYESLLATYTNAMPRVRVAEVFTLQESKEISTCASWAFR